MSGFAILVLPEGASAPSGIEGVLAAALAPIGPDRQNYRQVGRAILCHRLLAITPEEAGDEQPATLDGESWLVGDLRLDAREALAAALRQHGRSVTVAAPDSVLVLHAWAVWGRRCVEHLIGDFAFAIWSERERRLFAARDQLGVAAALFVAQPDGALLVSNAMRAMRRTPGISDEIDPQGLGDFIVMGHCGDPRATVFRAIRRVPAAHAISFAEGRLTEDPYWTPAPGEPGKAPSDAECVERFVHAFGEAVADRMRCPSAGLSLSGGLDSGLIAGFAREARREGPINAYTVGFDWLLPDTERYFAGLTAKHLGLDYHPRSVDGFLANPPGGHWRIAPEPRGDMRVLGGGATVGDLAAHNTRLVLNGTGGDQLAVAPPAYWADLALGGRFGALVRDGWRYRQAFGRRPPLRSSLAARFARGAFRPVPKWDWLDPDFAAGLALFERFEALARSERRGDGRVNLASNPFWAELLAGLSPEHSGLPIKSTYPYFDLRVIAAAQTLPMIPWLSEKYILRRAGAAMLPAAILARRKAAVGAYASWELAKRGIEPARASLAQPGPIDHYVDRTKILARLERVDLLDPREYQQGINRVAGLAEWFATPASVI